jgi:HSP20 family protein
MLPNIWNNRGLQSGQPLDNFLDNFFNGLQSNGPESNQAWTPRVDVHENDKDVYLDVEVPGIRKKDIHVEVKNGTLTISGERTTERQTEDADSCRVERQYGKFERSFELSDAVKSDDISAAYKDGVLTLTVPKAEKAIPKEIQIVVK